MDGRMGCLAIKGRVDARQVERGQSRARDRGGDVELVVGGRAGLAGLALSL